MTKKATKHTRLVAIHSRRYLILLKRPGVALGENLLIFDWFPVGSFYQLMQYVGDQRGSNTMTHTSDYMHYFTFFL